MNRHSPTKVLKNFMPAHSASVGAEGSPPFKLAALVWVFLVVRRSARRRRGAILGRWSSAAPKLSTSDLVNGRHVRSDRTPRGKRMPYSTPSAFLLHPVTTSPHLLSTTITTHVFLFLPFSMVRPSHNFCIRRADELTNVLRLTAQCRRTSIQATRRTRHCPSAPPPRRISSDG